MRQVTTTHCPVVSVVIPAYNAERTIDDAIRSVIAGTSTDFEVVVCDDASTDRTVEIVRTFADSRVRLVRLSVNSGEGMARDAAMAAAKGKWVAFLDADDLYEPGRIDSLVDLAVKHPDAVVFDELLECHDTPKGIVRWRPIRRMPRRRTITTEARRVDFSEWIGWERTVIQPLIPTSLILKYNVRHSVKRYSADLEFLLTLLGRSRAELWYLPAPMYLYRVAAGSMSTVADRYALLTQTLEDALALFADDPSAMNAIRCKAGTVRRAAEYHMFFSSLARGKLLDAARTAIQKPWVIPEFFARCRDSIPYHFSRWWHGGFRRRTA